MSLETELLNQFVLRRPAEAAYLLESMPADDAASVLANLGVEPLGLLLRRIAPLAGARALERVPPESAGRALSVTHNDAAAAILRTMSTIKRTAVVEALEPEAQRMIRRLLRYSEGTAGALMDPQVLSVGEQLSVASVLERLRQNPQHALYYVYVVDDDHKLVGVVNMRELMEARPDQRVGLLAVRTVESLSRGASTESIVRHPGWKRFHALPVVEADRRFLGVIRYESVRNLEHRMEAALLDDQGARTAAALGEVYGVGLRSLFDWVGSAFLGPEDSEKRS